LKSEMFDAALDASACAVLPVLVVAEASIEPVTTTDPDEGYA
jgi:hypothetical protein